MLIGTVSLPHDESCPFFRELIDILFRIRVALIQSSVEEMGELVKFAELPLRIRGILSPSYRRRILVVFLIIGQRAGRWMNKETDFEITEERVHEEVDYDEWCEYSVEYTHEYESPL